MKVTTRLAVTISAIAVTADSAMAVIAFDPDGAPGGIAIVESVDSFDWLHGSAYSDGGSQAITNFVSNLFTGGDAPTQSTSYFHAALDSMVTTTGSIFTPTPHGVEFTLVAGFEEDIAGVDLATNNVSFRLVDDQPTEFVEIYYDDTPDADALAGTGYNNGMLILRANITDLPSSFFQASTNVSSLDTTADGNQYPTVLTAGGSGTSTFHADVTYTDPAFFKTSPEQLIIDAIGQIPFDSVNPSDAFVTSANTGLGDGPGSTSFNLGAGVPGVGIGQVNGAGPANGGGPDFIFKLEARLDSPLPQSRPR